MTMKYTEEIFNILSKGGFISSNSVSTQVKRLYDAIEEDLPDYYDYYKGIGFYLEGGDGYYYFTRKESKVDLERKLEAIKKWIANGAQPTDTVKALLKKNGVIE